NVIESAGVYKIIDFGIASADPKRSVTGVDRIAAPAPKAKTPTTIVMDDIPLFAEEEEIAPTERAPAASGASVSAFAAPSGPRGRGRGVGARADPPRGRGTFAADPPRGHRAVPRARPLRAGRPGRLLRPQRRDRGGPRDGPHARAGGARGHVRQRKIEPRTRR